MVLLSFTVRSLRSGLQKHLPTAASPEGHLLRGFSPSGKSFFLFLRHKVEDLRDQLRKSASFTLPKPRADEEGKRHSRLRELKTHLEGVDTLEETREERESVQSASDAAEKKLYEVLSGLYRSGTPRDSGVLSVLAALSTSVRPARHPDAHGQRQERTW